MIHQIYLGENLLTAQAFSRYGITDRQTDNKSRNLSDESVSENDASNPRVILSKSLDLNHLRYGKQIRHFRH